MRRNKPTFFFAFMTLLAMTAFLPGVVWGAGVESGCLTANGHLQPEESGPAELFLTAAADDSGVVSRLSCVDGSLERISLRVEPGQHAEIALTLSNAGFEPTLISQAMASEHAWSSEWVHLEVLQGEVPAGGALPVALIVSVPTDYAPGTRHEQRFDLVGEEGKGLSVVVALEVIEEQPMFRDGFDVDPVLGQFSYRIAPGLNPGS